MKKLRKTALEEKRSREREFFQGMEIREETTDSPTQTKAKEGSPRRRLVMSIEWSRGFPAFSCIVNSGV